MADFATPDDVAQAWRPLSSAERSAATFWLPVASAYLRSEFVDIDDRIDAGTLDALLVRGVAVRLVRQAIENPGSVKSRTQQAGPFQESVTLNDAAAAGEFELSDAQRAMLTARSSRAFTITPSNG